MTLEEITAAVQKATADGVPLTIIGSGSKAHLGHPPQPQAIPLSVRGYEGIIDYHPEELVIRVKAGTPISTLTAELDAAGQMLAFEPPNHGATATIGGVISAGLSGSRRPFAGSARDYVLGVGLVGSNSHYHEFGGQVMKNVAGYDVSRLVCGAFGTLGIIADVSLKVLPKPELEVSVALSLPMEQSRQLVRELMARVSSLSAACYVTKDENLMLRFSGTERSVAEDLAAVGGDQMDSTLWQEVDRQHVAGIGDGTLWRLSTDPEEPMDQHFDWLDWGFGQRWRLDPNNELTTDLKKDLRETYKGAGHWTRFSAIGPGEPFGQPAAALLRVHQKLKQTFDPNGIFNPGRMYTGI